MKIESVKVVTFSPTGTSKAIAMAMTKSLRQESTFQDITNPEARKARLKTTDADLLVVVVPVYSGRVASMAAAWLKTIEASGSPCVCVVLYGNRAFEDALLELRDILKERGAVPMAGAAFIGEHSFSCDETPVAVGRPDAQDLRKAEEFGTAVREKLNTATHGGSFPELAVPGDFPYKERKATAIDFIAVNDDCTQCGLCEVICPAEAIDLDAGVNCDKENCIHCCACIKICPEQARSMAPSKFKDGAQWLTKNCTDRKEPKWYL